MRVEVYLTPSINTTQLTHPGPRDPKDHWRLDPRRRHGQASRDEEQLQVSEYKPLLSTLFII